jgi:beta-lactamase class A/uncharacterized protein YgiM (DUF1202 family)
MLTRFTARALIAISLTGWLLALPGPQTTAQTPDVFAEAVGQANLRAGPGVEYPVVGEIVAGNRYRVLARHAYVPWLRLDHPAVTPGEAWVYADLVTVIGNLASVPTMTEFNALTTPTPQATATASPTPTPDPVATWTVTPETAAPETTVPPEPSATPTLFGPTVTTLGETNIRFGPGVDFAPIVKVPAGSTYRILERHAVYPWLHIAIPESPSGTGWIYTEIVEIQGDLSLAPVSTAQQFGFPSLTPTPPTVIISGSPWEGVPPATGDLAATLGEAMHAYLLEQGFAPYSEQLGSVFVLDLSTYDTFAINDNVAFSGMSLTKIAILATYFLQHRGPLTWDEAYLIADIMMCSENINTNRLLALIGNGDPVRGAQHVTAFLQSLDLDQSFILSPYLLSEDDEPILTGTVQTGADQAITLPDISNQITPRDLGWLLAGIYQCARDETGLLIAHYPDEFNEQECRQMLRAMDANEIGVFIEAGVPPGTQVIHKHGWIGDTHGDAGIVIGPETAYVFVVALYGKSWLQFDLSAPTIAELSRMAWNALNPHFPLALTTSAQVPLECDPANDPVMSALLTASLPPPGP